MDEAERFKYKAELENRMIPRKEPEVLSFLIRFGEDLDLKIID